ncbi:MAG: DNA-protecting protein DprA [Cellulomonadaceae bacterium]|nr:DNA-protecting protein DprA [Cellulomonadaceae bacterium]
MTSSGLPVERNEVVALLALLRNSTRRFSWADISAEVRLEGSATSVWHRVSGGQETLFPEPGTVDPLKAAEAELAAWEHAGLQFVTVLCDDYPTRLASTFDCPPILFYRGRLDPADSGMSIVGSRAVSREGLAMAGEAVRILADRHLTVISGLAEGVDTAAHRAALDVGARTVAVIGTGIRKVYPSTNAALHHEIAENGLIISQFYPDQPPNKTTFPMRNGTMSGYGMATIIIEASEYSGSRIQARKAADHGRPVILSNRVAAGTSWGAEMAHEPWVTVVTSRDDLERAVDAVLSSPAASVLKELGLVTT